jgi:hypothetical protein
MPQRDHVEFRNGDRRSECAQTAQAPLHDPLRNYRNEIICCEDCRKDKETGNREHDLPLAAELRQGLIHWTRELTVRGRDGDMGESAELVERDSRACQRVSIADDAHVTLVVEQACREIPRRNL